MIISGAGGHALEVLDELKKIDPSMQFSFFDNINKDIDLFQDLYPMLHFQNELTEAFSTNPFFSLGVGSPELRKLFFEIMSSEGGVYKPLRSISSQISPSASGDFDTMAFSYVGPNTYIGKGTLVNTRANVHHDCRVGEYVEIGPGALVLGQVQLGSFVKIGAGAVILPGVKLGENVIVGAGAVVTKNVPDGQKVKGIPAK